MISIIISMLIAFFTTFILTPYFMRFLLMVGLVGIDQQKKDKPILPSAGGICVATGVLAALLSYIGIQTFVYDSQINSISLLAVISTVLIVTFVGILDDLNVKSKKIMTKEGMDIRIGLPQWIKPLLTLIAAIPLMVISAGVTTMSVPFIGEVNFGILYPLFLIPIGVVGASNMINMLGGFNGLEAGMGIVYMSALGIYALMSGINSAVIFLTCGAALFAFLIYNWYPARILPGDSLTYLLGAVIASGVILGNMEKAGIIILIPFFAEFLLKLRSRFKASSLGKLGQDGKMYPPNGKSIYSLTHLVMNMGKFTEKQIVLILISVEVSVAALFLLLS